MAKPIDDRLSHLVTLGEPSADPLRPAVDKPDRIRLDPGETKIWSGRQSVTVQHWNEQAGALGGKERWETTIELDSKATVVVSDRRLVYCWPRWKKNAGLIVKMAGRGDILAGQVHLRWITSIFASHGSGMIRRQSHLRVDVQDGRESFCVSVHGLDPDQAQRLLRQLATETARERLDNDPDLDDDQRARLSAIVDGGAPKRLDWANRHPIPGGMKLGFDYPKPKLP